MRVRYLLAVLPIVIAAQVCGAAEYTHEDVGTAEQKIVLDILRMEACREAWNFRNEKYGKSRKNDETDYLKNEVSISSGELTTLNGVVGLQYTYSTNDNVTDLVGVCGSYFIPGDPKSDPAKAQFRALYDSLDSIKRVAAESPASTEDEAAKARWGSDFLDVVARYQTNVRNQVGMLDASQRTPASLMQSLPITQSPPKPGPDHPALMLLDRIGRSRSPD